MVDLHSHVLPDFDDGPQTAQASAELLKAMKTDGVSRLFLTSHAYLSHEPVESYLFRRKPCEAALAAIYDPQTMPAYKLGAEVRYTADLIQMDYASLCLEGGKYLLLELPTDRYPAHLERLVSYLDMHGVTPILAHVERYDAFRNHPELLYTLHELGALAQVSADRVAAKQDRNFCQAAIDHGLVQFVASDAHNTTNRPPTMSLAKATMDAADFSYTQKMAQIVWEGGDVPFESATPMKKTLFGTYK